ncbi:MAG TPA: biopolymer transporter ExbD [Opitutaceae bacterium]|jgi:biopolymer transport protein ExbD|nr:biopolymer transporter ExbD [Opitutaceae bacterium]
MITRPLDLASRPRRMPRNFDAFYFINAGLIVLFFLMFGSRFVLAPGLGVRLNGGFALPTMEGAQASAVATNVFISVPRSGVALVDEGMITYTQLGRWLQARAKEHKAPVLLIRADGRVPMQDIAHIEALATAAGFVYVQVAFEESAEGK